MVLAAGLMACGGDSTGPGSSRAPEPGRYNYESEISMPAGYSDFKFSGALVITRATQDSVFGTWDVPGFRTAMDLGFWNDDAYVVYAKGTTAHTFPHRIAWGDKPTCEIRVTGINSSGQAQTHKGTCTLSRAR